MRFSSRRLAALAACALALLAVPELYWTGLQLDEVADPVVLAWQLGRSDPETWRHVERAAGWILAQGPTSQERWENTDD